MMCTVAWVLTSYTASGLTSYTGLSSPLRLMTMWIWSSPCERSFSGPPRSLRCVQKLYHQAGHNVVWLVCLLHWTSCLLICMPLSLFFATFRHIVSGSRGWFHLQFQKSSLPANGGGGRRGGRTVSSQLICVSCSYNTWFKCSAQRDFWVSVKVRSIHKSVRLKRSTLTFPWGWYGVVWECCTPHSSSSQWRQFSNSPPWSWWILNGKTTRRIK